MVKTTKSQRQAIKRVFDRQPLFAGERGALLHHGSERVMTYREFRKTVVSTFDCIMLPWCGMWLGIETDGYTHS